MTQSAQNIFQDNTASVNTVDPDDISMAQPQASVTTETDEQTKEKEYSDKAFKDWLKELDENQRKVLEAYQKLNAQFIYKIADDKKLKSAFGIVLDDYKTPPNVISFAQKIGLKKAPLTSERETFISTDDTVPTAFEISRKNGTLSSIYTGERPFDAYAAEALVTSILLGQPDNAKITINIANATAEQKILIHKAIEDFIQNTRPDLKNYRHATFNTRIHLGDAAKDSFNVASVGDDMDAMFGAQQEAAPINVTENSAATSETATQEGQAYTKADEKAAEKASSDALKRAFRDAATIPSAVYEYAKKTVMETGKASGPALRNILKQASEPVSHEKALRDKLVADGILKKKEAGNGYDVIQRSWDHLKPSA